MKIKIFYPDTDGSIRFSKQELQALLDEVYKEGYNDARPYYWQSPYLSNSGSTTTTPYITYSSSNSLDSTVTISNKDIPCTYTAAEQTLAVNREEATTTQEYQIKFETIKT